MDNNERIVGLSMQPEEETMERTLRPKRFSEYVGQRSVTDNLKIYIEASKIRKEPLDHVLFY